MLDNGEELTSHVMGARLFEQIMPYQLSVGGKGKYEELQILELEEICRLRNLDAGGLKVDIIQRLEEHDEKARQRQIED